MHSDTAKERFLKIAVYLGMLCRGTVDRGASIAGRCAAFPKAVERWIRRRQFPCKPLNLGAGQHLSSILKELCTDRLEGSAIDCERDVLGAARFAIALLLNRPELRQRFPLALSAGARSDYCQWICTTGAREFGLSPHSIENLKEAFDQRPGEAVRHVYDYSPALRDRFPLGLMRCGQLAFARWLFASGKRRFPLRDEEIWWFLLECSEDPTEGVAATYLRSPAWQERFPLAITPFQWSDLLKWIRRRYRVAIGDIAPPEVLAPVDEVRLLCENLDKTGGRVTDGPARATESGQMICWLWEQKLFRSHRSSAWKSRLHDEVNRGRLQSPGINVLGFFGYPSGLREAALTTVRALTSAGIETTTRNLPVNRSYALVNHSDHMGLEIFPHSLLIFNPGESPQSFYKLSGLHMRPGVHRIAYWYWELEMIPPGWANCTQGIQQIWAPTNFIADAMRRAMPVPVVNMLPGLELGPFIPHSRAHFGLPEDRYVFLFVFDMCSVMERKNPLAVVRAFRQAFGRNDRATLVIKVSRGDFDKPSLQRLVDETRAAGAILIDRQMSREDSYALINTCDCYVSLHRSEGFGLTMAEAMLMRKPVIATGYSGNLDFMTPENSRLVDYRRVPITDDLPHYPKGAEWAEPSVDSAAHWMRWAYENPEEASSLGCRAEREVARALSLEAAGKRMASGLRGLQTELEMARKAA